MIINVDIPYEYFQVVYLKTDTDQKPRMVIGIRHCADNGILIGLANGTETSYHYLGEIAEEKDVLLQTN